MKIKIGDKIIDSEDQPIMLIFENDEQLSKVASNLSNMGTNPGNIRKYTEYNEKTLSVEEVKEFMKIS